MTNEAMTAKHFLDLLSGRIPERKITLGDLTELQDLTSEVKIKGLDVDTVVAAIKDKVLKYRDLTLTCGIEETEDKHTARIEAENMERQRCKLPLAKV